MVLSCIFHLHVTSWGAFVHRLTCIGGHLCFVLSTSPSAEGEIRLAMATEHQAWSIFFFSSFPTSSHSDSAHTTGNIG
jgi:hypothetical protein